MSEYFKGLYIAQLSNERQQKIESELYCIGLEQDDIDRAMGSRICDLIDTIDIASVLQLA